MKNKSFRLLWIAVSLLLVALLLSAVSYCASPMRRIKIVQSTLEIPEGWEIVSQADGVTHIRMQEDADAYRWVVEQDQQKDFYMDVAFGGNSGRNSMKPDENGEYHVIAYVGYNQAEAPDGMQMQDYRLTYTNGETNVDLYSFDAETITTQKNVVYDGAKVGLTEAFIYSIPESKLTDSGAYMVWSVDCTCTDSEGTSVQQYWVRESVGYTLQDGMMHFDSQYADAVEGKDNELLLMFLAVLGSLLAPIFGVVVGFVLVYAILWTVRCTRERSHPLMVTLPCWLGAACALLVMMFFAVRHGGGMFGYLSQVIVSFLIAAAFVALAVILLIVRLIAGKIQKRKDEKKVQETAQSQE